MLARTSDRSPGKGPRRLAAALLAGALLLVAVPARAADDDKSGGSLALIPDDAAFYSASLRTKEQLDKVAKSKAYKRLMDLQMVKDGLAKAKEEMGKEGNPFAGVLKFLGTKDGQELTEVLYDAIGTDYFFYGGGGWVDFLNVLLKANSASSAASLSSLAEGAPDEKAQFRAMLRALDKDRAKLKIPELVIGFKVSDAKKAEKHIAKLEKIVAALTDEQPMFKGKLKRTKVGASSFLTLNFDGGMIPWDEIPLKEFESKAGELDDLVKHLKGQKLTVSLGVHHGFLLLAVSPAAEDLAKLGGKGKKLADRAELKPLAKHAKKPLVSIGYVSKAFNDVAARSQFDPASMVDSAKAALAKADLPAEKKKAIEKDLDALAKDLAKVKAPEAGASLAFQYMTDAGYEGYSYDYAKHPDLKGVKLGLLEHFGGNPIFAAGVAFKCDGEAYASLAKWVKVAYGHADDIALSKLDADQKDHYTKAKKAFLPLIKKLDETTSKLLIPAFKDGALGLVLDAKWKSKKWHSGMPTDKEMPGLELGLLLGLSDGGKFAQAMKEYRLTLNEIFEKAKEVGPKDDVPDFKLSAPDKDEFKGGALYSWKVPKGAGLDERFLPTAGVMKTVAALTLSKAHAERLLLKTPLAVKGGPLAAKKDLVAACYLDWPALIDAVAPWVEFSVGAGMGPDRKKEADEVIKQVRVVLDVMKCFQRYSSATYLEDGVLVTQTETIIKDR